MRFGCFIPQGWTLDLVGIPVEDHWPTMTRVAKAAEQAGFESGWVFDHFHTTPVATQEPTYEAWSLMAALAVATDTLRLGQMCTCNGYRPPAYLAHVAASIDVISGGRLEMGIGAGWYEHEWRAYGYGFPPARERLRMLDEGVQIMRQAWTEGKASLDGKHYQVDGAIVRPLPLQEGGIPLWIAGGGEQVTLKIAAKYANYTNFIGTAEVFARKSEILKGHCETVGTDFDKIVRSANFNVFIGETEAEVQKRIDAAKARLAPYVGAEKAENAIAQWTLNGESPTVGTPSQIVDKLGKYTELGLGYGIFNFHEAAYDQSGLELFEREVIPALR